MASETEAHLINTLYSTAPDSRRVSVRHWANAKTGAALWMVMDSPRTESGAAKVSWQHVEEGWPTNAARQRCLGGTKAGVSFGLLFDEFNDAADFVRAVYLSPCSVESKLTLPALPG